MSNYSLEKWCFGVSWQTIKRWRGIVANIVGKPEAVPEVYGPFRHCYPTLGEIVKPIKAVQVVADKPESVIATTSRTSLTLWRDWLAVDQPTNIVSGRQPVSNYVQHCGTGAVSPRRDRHRGGGLYGHCDVVVEWPTLAESVGAVRVIDVLAMTCSNYRRLDLLASSLCRGKPVPDCRRDARRTDAIGFAGCSDRTIWNVRAVAGDNVLRFVAERAESHYQRQYDLANRIAELCESQRKGLSVALSSMPKGKAADVLGVSRMTLDRDCKKVLATMLQNS